jgi:hypothetical protein
MTIILIPNDLQASRHNARAHDAGTPRSNQNPSAGKTIMHAPLEIIRAAQASTAPFPICWQSRRTSASGMTYSIVGPS